MSFLLQEQFYQLSSFKQSQGNSSNFFSNLTHVFTDWNVSVNSQNLIQAFTTEFGSMMYRNLQHLVKLTFSTNPSSLNIDFFILKNYIPIKIDSISHKITLYGFLLKINSSISIGKFSICPRSGLFKFGAQLLLSQSILNELRDPKTRFSTNNFQIMHKIEDLCINYQVYMQKIFKLINFSSSLFESTKNQNEVKNRNEKTSYEDQLEKLEYLLPYTHDDFGYLIRSGFHSKQNKNKKILNLFQKIFQILDKNQPKPKCIIELFSSDKLKQLARLERVNDQKTVSNEKVQKPELLLERQSLKKIKIIHQSDNFSVDLLSGVKFLGFKDFKQKNSLRFIKKSPVSQKGLKLMQRQQKFINLFMEEGGKQGIAQYFQINVLSRQGMKNEDNPPQIVSLEQNSLFIAFYPQNLNDYLSERRQFLSFYSKILLLLKIDKALSYLHCKMCQHYDLKPENIMIDFNENIRLIDFGQSIHPKLPLNLKPGVSIPYSPPQFFSKYKPTPEGIDVYSFGVIIFEMIFEDIPQSLPSRKEKAVPFYQSLSKYESLFYYQPQKLQGTCQKDLAFLIAKLCLKCMNSSQSLRPLQSWLRVYLKKVVQLSFMY